MDYKIYDRLQASSAVSVMNFLETVPQFLKSRPQTSRASSLSRKSVLLTQVR